MFSQYLQSVYTFLCSAEWSMENFRLFSVSFSLFSVSPHIYTYTASIFLNGVMWPLELWEQILYANMSHPLSQTKYIYISLYILSVYCQIREEFIWTKAKWLMAFHSNRFTTVIQTQFGLGLKYSFFYSIWIFWVNYYVNS